MLVCYYSINSSWCHLFYYLLTELSLEMPWFTFCLPVSVITCICTVFHRTKKVQVKVESSVDDEADVLPVHLDGWKNASKWVSLLKAGLVCEIRLIIRKINTIIVGWTLSVTVGYSALLTWLHKYLHYVWTDRLIVKLIFVTCF